MTSIPEPAVAAAERSARTSRSSSLAVVLALAAMVLLAPVRPADAATCRPAYPATQSGCSKDSQCCAGLVCQTGACRSGCRVNGRYYAAGALNPQNPCQSCQPTVNTTTFTSVPNGTLCNDFNGCTRTDTCQGGTCTGANPVTCSPSDQCHSAGTCSPSTGLCSNPPKPNGTSCNDGSLCTQTDTCQNGACAGSNPISCPAPPDQCHGSGTCDRQTGTCSYPAKPNGVSCNDGSACTHGETCQSGACTPGSTTVCPLPDQCHDAGVCDPATGACSNPAKKDGAPCDDGDACTTVDTCQTGACAGSSPVICPPSINPCQQPYACNHTTGQCVAPNQPDGTSCDNHDRCDGASDTCQSGICTGSSPVLCPAPDQCHNAGTCDPATGACSNPQKPDETPCSDGTACTTGDRCLAGACTPTGGVICPPTLNLCVSSVCDPATGQCVGQSAPNGTACTDSNPCTTGDSCQGGICLGSACSGTTTCCGEAGCKDLGWDSANCGACGHTCVNSLCLLGQCYDGCVIDGAGYPNGASNPGNGCQRCDTSYSRTAWKNVGNFPNDTIPCGDGCYSGFCYQGGCFVTSQSGGCPVTTCSVSSCNSIGVCVATPQNEGAACTPPISTNPCRSSVSGTCQSGQCVQDSANEGGYCRVTSPINDFNRDCRSQADGHCASGSCSPDNLPDGTVCHGNGGPCYVGSCVNGTCPQTQYNNCAVPAACGGNGTCDQTTGICGNYPGPFPDSGQVNCGGLVSGYRPEWCCPGQICICPPGGDPSFCVLYYCWWPGELP